MDRETVDFTSGNKHRDISTHLLSAFKDLAILNHDDRRDPNGEPLIMQYQFCKALLHDSFQSNETQLLETGSVAEGVEAVANEPVPGAGQQSCQYESETDYMVKLRDVTSDIPIKMEAVSSNSCFVRLKIEKGQKLNLPGLTVPCLQTEEHCHISSKLFMELVRGKLELTLGSASWQQALHGGDWFPPGARLAKTLGLPQHFTGCEAVLSEHGPAIQITITFTANPVMGINNVAKLHSDTEGQSLDQILIDLVPSLHLPTWPEHATEWISRTRMWPPQSLVNSIVSQGVLVVCKAPRGGNLEIDWRLSFSEAEVALLSNRELPCRNHAHKIFKYIVKHLIHRPRVINSYHCKTITLWACERLPTSFWSWDNLGKCVLGK